MGCTVSKKDNNQSPVLDENHSTFINGIPYLHYLPSKDKTIQLEFYYPADWVLREEVHLQGYDTYFLALTEPKKETDTPRVSDESIINQDNIGAIQIFVQPSRNEEHVQELVSDSQQVCSLAMGMELLRSYETKIDEKKVYVVDCQIDNLEDSRWNTPYFSRSTFFSAGEKSYVIVFEVALTSREDDFEKGYAYLISSLKILEK